MSRHSEKDGVHSTSYCAKKKNDANYDKRAGAGGKPELGEDVLVRVSCEACEEIGSMTYVLAHCGTADPPRDLRFVEWTYSHIRMDPLGATIDRDEGRPERADKVVA